MKVLMLRHSAGFEHSYLPNAEVALKDLGREHGWQVRTTHKCEAITSDALADLDVLIFATTGNLPFDATQKRAITSFIKKGKGFVGIHNAADTGYDWSTYGRIVGGYFNGHPWSEEVQVKVEDQDHLATCHLPATFPIREEVYTFKKWSRKKVHVLMSLDNDSVDIKKGNRKDNDYAMAWCQTYGKGRSIYTGLGHYDEVWQLSWFRQHIAGCIRWAAGE